jgi:hypothetical protein
MHQGHTQPVLKYRRRTNRAILNRAILAAIR